MTMFFSRPEKLEALPKAVMAKGTESSSLDISPEFLSTLVSSGELAFFNSRDRLHAFVYKPTDVHEVLVTRADCFLKGEQEQALSSAIGWGLLGFEGDVHKNAQRRAGPAFRAEALDRYFLRVSEVMNEHIKSLAKKSYEPLVDGIRCLTQDSAEQALFPHKKRRSDYAYQRGVLKLNELILGGEAIEGGPKISYESTVELKKVQDEIANYVRALVSEVENSDTGETTLLDYIRSVGNKDTDRLDSLHQQVSLFLQASVETTATLICWVILLLNKHPDYWHKLRQEIDNLKGEVSSFEKLKQLQLHSAVMSEALRLYPPAWMIPRVAKEDLSISGTLIPKGARLVLSPYVSHRLESNFSKAKSFDPSRWFESEMAIQRGAYFPFGLGSRICIGERFAKLTAILFLFELIKSGHVAEVDKIDLSIRSHSLLLNLDQNLKFKLVRFE